MADNKRAAPRKAKKTTDEAPIFLEKSFQMVETCPPEVVSWTEAGNTFIVKDLEAFCDLLPKFFKHRNFRSFVRQLNFYGFRKLRNDTAANAGRPAGWWEFKHEKFLRGRSDLLPYIKRAEHYVEEGNGGGGGRGGEKEEEAEQLRGELLALQGRVTDLNCTVEQLTGLVEALLLERATGIIDMSIPAGVTTAAEALSKKRRCDGLAATPSAPSSAEDLTSAFGVAPARPELEGDEAKLLSQLSLASVDGDDCTMLPTAPAMERSFSSMMTFDFSDQDDAGLKSTPSLQRSSSSASSVSSVPDAALSNATIASFFAGVFSLHEGGAGEFAVPAEPHLAEVRRLTRTTSGVSTSA